MSSPMIPISEFNTTIHTGRILVFCPTYPEGHEMRMRILDAEFVRFADEITHFCPLTMLEPRDEETIYEEHGFADRADYLGYLSEEHNVDLDTVYVVADILGEDEDFDGLVSALEDGL